MEQVILRLWSGWTTADRAGDYDHILDTDVAPGIVSRNLPGLERFEVWHRVAEERGDRHEFLTAMRFTDMAEVSAFAGPDPRHSVVPPQARALLADCDGQSRHYELRRRHV